MAAPEVGRLPGRITIKKTQEIIEKGRFGSPFELNECWH